MRLSAFFIPVKYYHYSIFSRGLQAGERRKEGVPEKENSVKRNQKSKPPIRGHGRLQTVDKVVKVFARLFQKAARSRARSPCRAPQSATLSCGAFFLQSFFFAPTWSKKKRRSALFFFGGITPFVYSLSTSHTGAWEVERLQILFVSSFL